MSAGYAAEVGGHTAFAGVDQGIDFTGQGPVYALGAGKIVRLQPSGSGWPGQGALLTYSIPSLGKYVYIAEDFVARAGLKVGSTISKGQVLGVATGSGQAPGIETGWATATGQAAAPYAGHSPTALGGDFQSFVQQLTASPHGTAATAAGGGNPLPTGSGFGGLLPAPHSVASGVTGAGKDLLNAAEAVPKFLGRLTDPNLWIRILEITGGGVIFLAGLFLLAKNVGLASTPLGAVASAGQQAPAVQPTTQRVERLQPVYSVPRMQRQAAGNAGRVRRSSQNEGGIPF